jgi:hypothetical protein
MAAAPLIRFCERQPERNGAVFFKLNPPPTLLLKHQRSAIDPGLNAEIP